MSSRPRLINVIDLEATCWEKKDLQGTIDPDSEIIEIGITTIDTVHKSMTGSKSIYVKNDLTDISEYCTNLTGISQSLLNSRGKTLEEAYDELRKDYKSEHELWSSWGFFDLLKLQEEADKLKLKFPFKHSFYLPAKALFHARYSKKRYSLINAGKKAGLPFIGAQHRASVDSWNTARLVMHCLEWTPVERPRLAKDCTCSTIPQARRCTRQCKNHVVPAATLIRI